MAQNAGSIKEKFSDYFTSTDNSYNSLLYLAQDLDLNDSAYDYVKITAKEKGLDLGDYIGSTQLLNSYSKLSSYSHPAYSNVYSYGLPTIGNGRRTLADFIDQPKNHVSKDKLQKLLTESISKTLENSGLTASDSLKDLISKAMTNDFNAIDDPSHYNLNNYEMQEADSIIVLDKRGNLIWGNAPQPKFSANYTTKENNADLIHRDGNVIYVEINQNGHYILETVNAAGLPLITLYNGTWSVGEHSISLSNYTIAVGSYLVLRMGSEIISWKLIN